MKSLSNWARVTVFFAAFLSLAFPTASLVFGATITATNTNDSGPGSLRAAIAAASPGDAINFDLNYPATITLASPLTINISLTIKGPGASKLAVSGGNSVGLFAITAGTVEISRLTIENGLGVGGSVATAGGIGNVADLTVIDTTFSGNFGASGGAIDNTATGKLTVTNSRFSNDGSVAGGGIANDGAASVTGSTFSTNEQAVFNSGTMTIADSTFSQNDGNPAGGGIFNGGGTLTIDNSTISENTAVLGAGIFSVGSLTITNSTISDNNADAGVGGIDSGGPLTITNSTISGNHGLFNGGILTSGTLSITNSTIAGNVSGFDMGTAGGIEIVIGTATIKNTLLAGNFVGGSGSTTLRNCDGTLTSRGHNLSDDSSCADFFTGPGDLNNTPSGLDPAGLKDNGGPTETIALLKNSPAVDAIPVNPNFCTLPDGTPVATDQRGFLRPQGPACDIGAFEYTTPAEATQTLISYLDTLDLLHGAEESLTSILKAALDALDRGNNGAAKNQLNAFVLHVVAVSRSGQIPSQKAAQLVQQVQLILEMLGGDS